MKKDDVKKEFRELYGASNDEPVVVDVPLLTYLMIDGIGDPNTLKAYTDAVEALFTVSYTMSSSVASSPQPTGRGGWAHLLAKDVVVRGAGGGKLPLCAPIVGADKVARLFARMGSRMRAMGVTLEGRRSPSRQRQAGVGFAATLE